jgi:Flp pilus assembly protein TadG
MSRRSESGTATVFVVGFAVVLLACAGLVIDGGNAINARMKLADDVEQAARAGAGAIDVGYLRSNDVVRLDPGTAQSAALAYMGDLGYSQVEVSVTADTVTVGGLDTVTTTLLQLVGVRTFDISARATAQAVTQ